MNVYDLNKAGYTSLPNLSEDELDAALDIIVQYLTTFDSNYYMLLNHDNRYFTLFTYKDFNNHDYYKMAQEIMDIAKGLGSIKSIERNGGLIEFWIMGALDEDCKMYAFFDYAIGVVDV